METNKITMKLVEINKFERKLMRQQVNDTGHPDAGNVFTKFGSFLYFNTRLINYFYRAEK